MGYKVLNFDKETKFLVTGGAGFIGSNLCEAILSMGCKVICLDNFSTGKEENIREFEGNPRFKLIRGDIRNLDTCNKACKEVDYVLHEAAWGSVPRSIEMPLLYDEINIKGTLNMMEAAKINKVKRFVYASSSSVYGDSEELPKIEGHEGKVLSPYALTKRVDEEYGRLYSMLYSLETVGLRYFNVFGKNQNPNGDYAAVIPKFIKLLLNNESPTIYGDGTQSRDFTYVENVVEANLKACFCMDNISGEVFNIGCDDRITLNCLFEELVNLVGCDITPIYKERRKGDVNHSNACIEKARKKLKYECKYKFKEGILKTIEWYKDNN